MRRVLAALLTGLLIAVSFGLLTDAPPSVSAPEPEANPVRDFGPHLMLPDPDVFPAAPFTQQADWTGTPPGTRGGAGTRATGTQDIIVLRIQFPDDSAGSSASEIQTSFAEVRTYYQEVSYNLMTVQATVGPLVTSGNSSSVYSTDGASYDNGNGPIFRLVTEAVRRTDQAGFNFANPNFDRDGDGVVDHLVVIHSKGAQEGTGFSSDIWSHRWAVVDAEPGLPGDQPLTVDGVRVYGYILASEDSPVGVLVHELGHDFDLPDLYDTDASSDGIGSWGVMGSGSWNGIPRGTVPAHFSAWAKVELGWITPIVVTSPFLGQAIDQVETNQQVFKLPISTTGGNEEYFLVENRQQTGYDSSLPAAGLLIWHVDEAQTGNSEDAHRLVDLEEADDNDRPTQTTDPWSDAAAGFGPDSSPNSNSYLNQRSGWKVRNIGPSGPTMSADLSREVDDDVLVTDVRSVCCVQVPGTASIEVDVENRGSRDQTGVVVNVSAYLGVYNRSAPAVFVEQTISSLPKASTDTLTFSVAAQTGGRYIVEASVELAGDEIPENNFRFTRFHAATYALFDNIDPPDARWATDTGPGENAEWTVLLDGTQSRSLLRSWHFGRSASPTCAPSCASAFNLSIEPIAVSGPTYLYFWHRYDFRASVPENFTGTPASDAGFVTIRVDGLARSSDVFVGSSAGWRAYMADLSPWTSGGATVNLTLRATADVLKDSGGWWIDDVMVSNRPLLRGLAARAVPDQQIVEPGGVVYYRFKVANVGDFDDRVEFDLTPPGGWDAAIGHNQTRLQAHDVFQTDLEVASEATLVLGFEVPVSAQRGQRYPVPVTAKSVNDATITSPFSTVTIINDPFGLAGLERYVFLFLIVLAAIIVVAVVIDAIKKQRGVYRRW